MLVLVSTARWQGVGSRILWKCPWASKAQRAVAAVLLALAFFFFLEQTLVTSSWYALPFYQVLLGTSVNILMKLNNLIEFDNEAKTYLHLASFPK